MNYLPLVVWFILSLIIIKDISNGFLLLREKSKDSPLTKSTILKNKEIFDLLDASEKHPYEEGCVVILSPKCPPCHQVLEDLAENRSFPNISFFLTNPENKEAVKMRKKYQSIAVLTPIHEDKVREIGISFTPAFITHDKKGVVRKVGVSYN